MEGITFGIKVIDFIKNKYKNLYTFNYKTGGNILIYTKEGIVATNINHSENLYINSDCLVELSQVIGLYTFIDNKLYDIQNEQYMESDTLLNSIKSIKSQSFKWIKIKNTEFLKQIIKE